jgi:hypothetical protein
MVIGKGNFDYLLVHVLAVLLVNTEHKKSVTGGHRPTRPAKAPKCNDTVTPYQAHLSLHCI